LFASYQFFGYSDEKKDRNEELLHACGHIRI
jgi:hypothetical protein